MRVTLCVDALSPEQAGIGRYTWELSKGLARSDQIDSLRYFARGRLIDDPLVLLTHSRLPRRQWFNRLADRWKTRHVLHSSLVHGPNYFLPDAAEQGVITVHDLSVFHFPETHPAARLDAFERRFKKSLERAAHIITDTETIRREVIEAFGVNGGSVTAIPLGVSPAFRPIDNPSGVSKLLSRWGLEVGCYGLCVSTLEPRKKIAELVRAWRDLPAGTRQQFPLVLAGGKGWRNDALRTEIVQASNEGWLRHLGFVDDADLPALYAAAALFIYPSIYEGFGLPPIEAMASGVPVIVSNRSCLPEVCGDAPRYVDPDDLPAFRTAIGECLSDEEWRSRAVERGVARAAEFTWERCVDDTVGVYRRVAGGD